MHSVLITCLFITVILYIVKSVKKPRNFPPGPNWYPYVGSSVIANREIQKHGTQWKGLFHLAKQYSTDILGLKLGNEIVIFVCGLENIRELSNRKEFDSRPDGFFVRQRTFGKRAGITFTDGIVWKSQRLFLMKYLREKGMGKLPIENEIIAQLDYIRNNIDIKNGKPLNTKSMMSKPIVNVLWKYIAGEYIDEDKLSRFVYLLAERSKVFSVTGGLLNEFPWIRFLLPERSGYNLLLKLSNSLSDIIEDTLKKHLNKQIPDHDFIYAYIEEIRKKTDIFSYDQLKCICVDLLIASAQTSDNTMRFAFLALIRFPDIQEKVYQEINNVLGEETPSWSDYSRLVYTNAFLQEVSRYYTVSPISGPRRALCDTTINNYFIPKGSTILTCLENLHMDPKVWDEPEVFRPERFIKDGAIRSSEYLVPFGIGRRRCPGSSLARPFIFIVLVGILQKFKIVSSDVPPSPEPMIGFLSEPKPFEARFIRR